MPRLIHRLLGCARLARFDSFGLGVACSNGTEFGAFGLGGYLWDVHVSWEDVRGFEGKFGPRVAGSDEQDELGDERDDGRGDGRGDGRNNQHGNGHDDEKRADLGSDGEGGDERYRGRFRTMEHDDSRFRTMEHDHRRTIGGMRECWVDGTGNGGGVVKIVVVVGGDREGY